MFPNALYHRGRAETAYRQPCPSCSRQHFSVNVFCLSSKQNRGKMHSLKMLSATGRTRLPIRSFCPPPVVRRRGADAQSMLHRCLPAIILTSLTTILFLCIMYHISQTTLSQSNKDIGSKVLLIPPGGVMCQQGNCFWHCILEHTF